MERNERLATRENVGEFDLDVSVREHFPEHAMALKCYLGLQATGSHWEVTEMIADDEL